MMSIQEVEAKARQMRAEMVGRTLSGVGAFLVAAPRKIARSLAAWNDQRRAYDELMALDDRQLRDMGLARSEIPAVVAGTFAPDSYRVEPKVPAVGANTNERKPAALRRVA
ncbi:RSP_7527 family protein [Stella sp.]|uniref:RSP_7527 family protein n=1 Tax=Stella sp. TaxID=2912054 RepID=UPI0035AF066F